MAGGHYVALSGMRTRLDELDRLASDIANVGTAGYKAERTGQRNVPPPGVRQPRSRSAIDVTTGARRLDVRRRRDRADRPRPRRRHRGQRLPRRRHAGRARATPATAI